MNEFKTDVISSCRAIIHWGLEVDALNFIDNVSLGSSIGTGVSSSTRSKVVAQMKLKKEKLLMLEAPKLRSDLIVVVELIIPTDSTREYFRRLRPQRVWRRIRCSGGLNLRQLQDRVLAPCMGWTRNYHGYLFIDPNDGSQFGPINTSSVDMTMHLPRLGCNYLSDLEVKLAQLLEAPGDRLLYLHDLGDLFWHQISLLEVIPKEESNGAIELLEGEGACPPEDSFGLPIEGCEGYEQLVSMSTDTSTSLDFFAKCNEVMIALNYQDEAPFRPSILDIDRRRAALTAAVMSSASVVVGAKMFNAMPGASHSIYQGRYGCQGDVYKVRVGPRKYLAHGVVPVEEVVRTGPDPESETVCRMCGSPHDLSKCSQCMWAFYCSRKCQISDWKQGGHKNDCKPSVKGQPCRPLPDVPDNSVRFKVGDRVECLMGEHPIRGWKPGRIIKLHYKEAFMPTRDIEVAPYQVKLDDGALIFAPHDDNRWVRRSRK